MALNESLMPEFQIEMATTRSFLERVPMEKADWRPHEKSMKMGDLARHLAHLASWVSATIHTSQLDVMSGDDSMSPPAANSAAELITHFDRNVEEAKASLGGADDATLLAPWKLTAGGQEIFTMPRIGVLRSMVMNHLIHHRAQLGVYLRMQGIPLPSSYGPSADEGGM